MILTNSLYRNIYTQKVSALNLANFYDQEIGKDHKKKNKVTLKFIPKGDPT